jgi:squalene-hopene/tetraprenyl-beta-curcumene cyclase
VRLPFFLFPLLACSAAGADFPAPAPTKATEPRAKEYSSENAAKYLDAVGVGWTREHKCISCHTNMPYMAARPFLQGDEGWKEVRSFLEKDVAKWSAGEKPRGDAYVVATSFALAFNDAQQTGKLQPRTKEALDRMITLQQEDGAWDWIKCNWPPLEHDDYYGATVAALALGYAPGDYAKSDAAKTALANLKEYFKKTPPPDLHHTAMLLWASTRLEGLMTPDEQTKAVAALKAKQRKDGGWALPALGTYKRRDKEKTPNNPNSDSDGYGTGYVTFVLLQAGVKTSDPAITSGVKWIKENQRESGRWFTRSLNNDADHFIAHAGTAYCVLALNAAAGGR